QDGSVFPQTFAGCSYILAIQLSRRLWWILSHHLSPSVSFRRNALVFHDIFNRTRISRGNGCRTWVRRARSHGTRVTITVRSNFKGGLLPANRLRELHDDYPQNQDRYHQFRYNNDGLMRAVRLAVAILRPPGETSLKLGPV